MSASAPGSRTARTKAETRSSAPRSSRISSTTARYSTSSSRVFAGGRRLVRVLLDLDAQHAARVRLGSTEDAPVETGHGHGLGAAREADALDDLGDGADGRVLGLVLRDQHDALVVTDVGRKCDVHAREDDASSSDTSRSLLTAILSQ